MINKRLDRILKQPEDSKFEERAELWQWQNKTGWVTAKVTENGEIIIKGGSRQPHLSQITINRETAKVLHKWLGDQLK